MRVFKGRASLRCCRLILPPFLLFLILFCRRLFGVNGSTSMSRSPCITDVMSSAARYNPISLLTRSSLECRYVSSHRKYVPTIQTMKNIITMSKSRKLKPHLYVAVCWQLPSRSISLTVNMLFVPFKVYLASVSRKSEFLPPRGSRQFLSGIT